MRIQTTYCLKKNMYIYIYITLDNRLFEASFKQHVFPLEPTQLSLSEYVIQVYRLVVELDHIENGQ